LTFQSKARVTALGAYVPEKILNNHDLEKMVDTNDEWIVQRTGINERRITEENEFTSHMACKAIDDLVRRYSVKLDDVDLVIVATLTPDYITPSVSAVVHGRFNLPATAGVMDLNAACAGFVYALQVANAMVTVGQSKKVLVVAGETLSKITDYTDRNTCVLFGDGAGAALVELDEDNPGFLGAIFGSEGKSGDKLFCTGLSDRFNGEPVEPKNILYQDGRAVYTFVIRTIPVGVKKLLEQSDMTVEEIDWFVPHSANLRMVHSISEKLGFKKEQALISLEEYGNTSSATIPLALWKALDEGKLKKGDKLALYGFGGGLTHAGLILDW
jgi:3-oxoacyl-[acyl-carrier-protein] synthase-3